MHLWVEALMIFSLTIMAFFGLPIAGIFLMSLISPSNIEPVSGASTITSTLEVTNEALGFPITVKKVMRKGKVIWVDAVDPVPNRF